MAMNHYEARQEARRQRLLDLAARYEREGNARYQRARQMADAIPFGQPILIGHHSEGRDRRYRAKIHTNFGKAFEASKLAQDFAAKADAVGTGGISSDDPEAVQKLKAELERLEAQQARMKAVNAAHKKFLKNPASLETSGLGDADKARVTSYQPAYSWEPHPYPPYAMSNNSANVRRIKGRIEQLSKKIFDKPAEEFELPAYKVVQNFEANRLQLVFPGKPSETVRSILKRNGFRWSPIEGAWQRMLSGFVFHVANPEGYVRKEIEKAVAV